MAQRRRRAVFLFVSPAPTGGSNGKILQFAKFAVERFVVLKGAKTGAGLSLKKFGKALRKINSFSAEISAKTGEIPFVKADIHVVLADFFLWIVENPVEKVKKCLF